MTSIRKSKKALKREARRIDAAIIELARQTAQPFPMGAIWDLFLWSNYLQRQIRSLGHTNIDPWTCEGRKPIPFSKLAKGQIIATIKNGFAQLGL